MTPTNTRDSGHDEEHPFRGRPRGRWAAASAGPSSIVDGTGGEAEVRAAGRGGPARGWGLETDYPSGSGDAEGLGAVVVPAEGSPDRT